MQRVARGQSHLEACGQYARFRTAEGDSTPRRRSEQNRAMTVQPAALPDHALLQTYARNGSYTDCFTTTIPYPVTHAQYVAAFYTTWVFKLERFILKWAVSRPSTDEQARKLAAGADDPFAAWSVEARAANQLLLCDMYGSTRSWLMAEPDGAGTRLYFGSAVVKRGPAGIGRSYRLLMGFHTLYSRVLLHAAKRRLESGRA